MKKAVVYMLSLALALTALTACGAYGMQQETPRASAMPASTPNPSDDMMMPDLEDGIVSDEDGILVEDDGVVTERKPTETAPAKTAASAKPAATVEPSAPANTGAAGKTTNAK